MHAIPTVRKTHGLGPIFRSQRETKKKDDDNVAVDNDDDDDANADDADDDNLDPTRKEKE